jgi:hypothetical protein
MTVCATFRKSYPWSGTFILKVWTVPASRRICSARFSRFYISAVRAPELGGDSRLMLGCRPDFYAMGDQLFIDLHGVDYDPVSDFNIGLLDRLLGSRVMFTHLGISATVVRVASSAMIGPVCPRLREHFR